MIEALITDLDGTFWSPQMEIHENSLAVVSQLDTAGLPFVIATGRRAQSTLQGLTPYGLEARPGILMNGALARDVLSGESFLVDAISTADADLVLDAFASGGLDPVAYVDHPETDMLVGPQSAAGAEYLARTVGYTRVDSLRDAVAESSVIGFGAFGLAYDLLAPIAERINDEGLATAIIGLSHIEGNHGIMIQGRAVDKWTGIQSWCARADVDPSQLAIVGDGHNDIEMLRNAKIGIVPNNAPPEIREIADAIIEPNEEGGWGQISDIVGL